MTRDLLDRLGPEDRLVWMGAAGAADPEQISALIACPAFDWARVLTTARDNRVLVRLSDTLMELEGVPPNIKAALVFYESKVRESVEGDREAFERALPAIVKVNSVMLLRGMAYAYSFDRDRPTRLIGTDVDLLIDHPRFTSLSGRFVDHHHIPKEVMALSPPRLEYHHDLNFKSSWCVRLAKIKMAELWARRRTVRIAGIDVGMLAVEDEIIYLAFHNATKRFVGLYRFIDLAQQIRSHDVDWDAVVRRAHRYRVVRPLWATLLMVQSVVPGIVPDEVVEQLKPPRIVRRLLRRLFDPSMILNDARRETTRSWAGTKQSIRRGLLYRTLLVRPSNALKILIGPLNLFLFLLYVGADRTPLLGGMIGRARSVVHRDRTQE